MIGILSSIVGVAVAVSKALAVVGLAVQGLRTLGNAMMGIAKTLGLLKPENRAEDLGDKALQAEESGIIPEQYDTYAEYIKAVETFDIDPEHSKIYTDEEKILKGVELTTGVMVETFPQMPIESFFKFAGENPEYFTEDRMNILGTELKETPEFLGDVLNYLDGTERDDYKLEGTLQTLINIEKTVNPEITDQDALKNVLNAGRKDA